MDETTRNCLREVIEYSIEDERNHWEADGKPDMHIYHCLKVLEDWYNFWPIRTIARNTKPPNGTTERGLFGCSRGFPPYCWHKHIDGMPEIIQI